MARGRLLGRALLLGVLLLACSRIEVRPAGPRGPSLVLVSIDTLRADHVGAYGADFARTPTLDGVAAGGTRFATALASSPLTLPSHASILTGLYPQRLGVRHNGVHRLGSTPPTLGERLRDAGYATGAVVGAFVLASRFGLARGFDHYDDDTGSAAGTGGFLERPATEVTDRALRWAEAQDGPYFLWVHYYDPHGRYQPPPPFAKAFAGRPYDGEIAYVDAELGRLLEGLPAPENGPGPLVAITSDHGESLGEHRESDHGHTLYDATLAVPLLLSGPGVPRGRVVEDLVRTVDLAPTLLSLLGLEPLGEIDGRDLRQLWEGPAPEPRFAYAETLATRLDFGWSPLYAIRTDRFHYVRAPRPELYDVVADPDQTRNLIEVSPEEAREVAAELDTAVAELLAVSRQDEARKPTRDELERLRALGYAIGAEPEAGPVVDPKDGLPSYSHFVAANEAFGAGDGVRARGLLEAALEVLPGSSRAHGLLGVLDLAEGRTEAALHHLGEAARLNPASAYYRAMLAEVHRARGESEEAEHAWQQAALLDASEPYVALGYVETELREGRTDAAWARTEEALAASPANADIRLRLGRRFERAGEYERALELYQDCLALDPNGGELQMILAIQLARLGREDEARQHLQRAGPHAQVPELRHRLAIVYAARGETARAEALLREQLAAHPADTGARRNLATLLRRAGRGAEAAEVDGAARP